MQPLIEGAERHANMNANPSAESTGGTIVLAARASRFIWELSCGERDRVLFERAMQTHRRGPKQPKYETPQHEHPDTPSPSQLALKLAPKI